VGRVMAEVGEGERILRLEEEKENGENRRWRGERRGRGTKRGSEKYEMDDED
jgi:hypothetical protein